MSVLRWASALSAAEGAEARVAKCVARASESSWRKVRGKSNGLSRLEASHVLIGVGEGGFDRGEEGLEDADLVTGWRKVWGVSRVKHGGVYLGLGGWELEDFRAREGQ